MRRPGRGVEEEVAARSEVGLSRRRLPEHGSFARFAGSIARFNTARRPGDEVFGWGIGRDREAAGIVPGLIGRSRNRPARLELTRLRWGC